jgi:NADH-quinone oxidoreductase subunit F
VTEVSGLAGEAEDRVDLRLMPGSANEDERAAVDDLLGAPDSGWHGGERRIDLEGHVGYSGKAAREQRHLLLPALHALQGRVGWISQGGLNYVCERLSVPPAEAYGVASFYAMFSLEPRPKTVLHVCDDIACRTKGANVLIDAIQGRLGPERAGALARSPCLGMCERAPAAMFQSAGHEASDIALGSVTEEMLDPFLHGGGWIADGGRDPVVPQPRDALRLLRRVGVVDPGSLDDYRAYGGYEALRTAIELGPEGVIREVTDARLLGRGGAAFPTGVKWEAVAKQPAHPHYFVCNADESEPGTFKDRVVMENDPFSVIEALTIAGFATASETGYVYIRGEYPHATRMVADAIGQARARGFLGEDVMGAGFRFDIELRRGAGAYIAGEETALFNSIEGKRAEPRNKPPFPVTHGLFGKPTGINNVETLINVLEILRVGGPAYARTGTPESTGTRLFCLSGCVERPGLYEVECGTILRELLRMAGGVAGGRELAAILMGGAAGGFVTPDRLDLPLSFEAARRVGVSLGSGVVMVFDDTVDLVDIVLRIATFFRDESCGQCVPCRVGTARQDEVLRRLATEGGNGTRAQDLSLLDEIAQVMGDASICGLGQTAASAVQSAVKQLRVFDGGSGS